VCPTLVLELLCGPGRGDYLLPWPGSLFDGPKLGLGRAVGGEGGGRLGRESTRVCLVPLCLCGVCGVSGKDGGVRRCFGLKQRIVL